MTIGLERLELDKTPGGSVFRIVINGKLYKQDYDEMVPQLEWQIATTGRIHLLIELASFQGFTLGAVWEEILFAAKHYSDIGKLAVIGRGLPWERGLTALKSLFTRAQVRFFDSADQQSAEMWIGCVPVGRLVRYPVARLTPSDKGRQGLHSL
ncbi:MAG: hypothetical protein VR64_09025 [Desulfatitalea sp. BRH_c12]|nr:MAG: hypothetical protein VR64_09025 [Desulfatitalea sp. BRH_c12]